MSNRARAAARVSALPHAAMASACASRMDEAHAVGRSRTMTSSKAVKSKIGCTTPEEDHLQGGGGAGGGKGGTRIARAAAPLGQGGGGKSPF